MRRCVSTGFLFCWVAVGAAQSSGHERSFRWPGTGLSRAVDGVTHAKALSAVREILRQAEHEVDAIDDTRLPGWNNRVRWMAALGDRQAAAGDLVAAARLADSLEHADRDQVLAGLAVAQAYASDAAIALRTAALIEDVCTRNQTLGDIATAQANAGHVSAAMRTAKGIRDAGCGNSMSWRREAIQGVAGIQALRGDVQGVRQTLALLRSKTFDARPTIAVAQAYAGDLTGALQTASVIRSAQRRVSVITEVALTEVALGNDQGALESIASIESPQLRTQALRDLLDFQAASGDVPGVRETTRVLAPQPEVVMSRLALAQTRAGTLADAWETVRVIAWCIHPDDSCQYPRLNLRLRAFNLWPESK